MVSQHYNYFIYFVQALISSISSKLDGRSNDSLRRLFLNNILETYWVNLFGIIGIIMGIDKRMND